MFSNLAYFSVDEIKGETANVSVFSSRNVKLHNNEDKVESLMKIEIFFKLLYEEILKNIWKMNLKQKL